MSVFRGKTLKPEYIYLIEPPLNYTEDELKNTRYMSKRELNDFLKITRLLSKGILITNEGK